MNEEKEPSQNLEDNLPMVNYIMLHRIYDLLVLISKSIAEPEEVQKMIDYHEKGFLLGPAPSFTSMDGNENV
jgi:hypothetical protein